MGSYSIIEVFKEIRGSNKLASLDLFIGILNSDKINIIALRICLLNSLSEGRASVPEAPSTAGALTGASHEEYSNNIREEINAAISEEEHSESV